MTETVILVGAGPGDPGLLTLAGRSALEQAQVLAYDALVSGEIVAMAPESAERIPVTRRGDPGAVPHTEISALMAARAKAGLRVVRLKGGDPFVFGRGWEERSELEALGVETRVIPGLTSALAAPACADLPVIRDGGVGCVQILSGRPRTGRPLELDYEAHVRAGGTLVFLMALEHLEEIAYGLMAAGMAGDTPAALIENGTLPAQRRVDAMLETLAKTAGEAGITEPAVVVVGQTCALRGTVLPE